MTNANYVESTMPMAVPPRRAETRPGASAPKSLLFACKWAGAPKSAAALRSRRGSRAGELAQGKFFEANLMRLVAGSEAKAA
jgi:hypothetical protein